MGGDDEVVSGWHVDPATRAVLRLEQIRKTLDAGDWGTAVIEAEELLDEEPDHPEGLFLLAEALLELGDAEAAADAYEHHLDAAREAGEKDDNRKAAALAGLAVARFECCDLPGSIEAARESLRIAPELGETHYYLGLALERTPGRKSEATAAFMAAHRLDPEAYPLPAQISPKQWDELLQKAAARLPPKLQRFWVGVAVRLETLPSVEELRRNHPPITPTVSGLYEGSPPDDDDPWTTKPKSLRLFTTNIARLGRTDAIVDEIERTLTAEALDWLDLTHDELD